MWCSSTNKIIKCKKPDISIRLPNKSSGKSSGKLPGKPPGKLPGKLPGKPPHINLPDFPLSKPIPFTPKVIGINYYGNGPFIQKRYYWNKENKEIITTTTSTSNSNSISQNSTSKSDLISQNSTSKSDLISQNTSSDIILVSKNKDLSPLQQYYRLVTYTTSKFLGITALGSIGIVLAAIPIANVCPPDTLFPIAVTAFVGSIIGSFYHSYKLSDTFLDTNRRMKHAYWMHACLGVMIAPLVVICAEFIPQALATTFALTMGPIAAAMWMPKGSMLPLTAAMGTCLLGLIGIGAGALIAPMLGFYDMGLMLHSIDMYVGVLFFTIYNAYHTQVMIDDFENGNEDHIGHSANYSLSAINIFIRILEILSKIKKNN